MDTVPQESVGYKCLCGFIKQLDGDTAEEKHN